MHAEIWVWENWQTIVKQEEVKDWFLGVLLLLAKKTGTGNVVALSDKDFEEIAITLGKKEHSIKKAVNFFWRSNILIKSGKTLTFPVNENNCIGSVTIEPVADDPVLMESIKEVFNFWIDTMKASYEKNNFRRGNISFSGDVKLTEGRKALIKNAIAHYGVEKIKDAIIGASGDEFFMEKNNDLNVLLRFNSKTKRNSIEHFSNLKGVNQKSLRKWEVDDNIETGEIVF